MNARLHILRQEIPNGVEDIFAMLHSPLIWGTVMEGQGGQLMHPCHGSEPRFGKAYL
jgi:hypothetical protein